MAFDFNADEIFEMAEQIERNGDAFYRDAAEKVGEADAKELLIKLADMEVDHEKTFKEMREGLTQKERESMTFDPENEAALYLKALADTRVFFEKTIDNYTMPEILKSAITAEKDSIVFYLGMKELVGEQSGKNKIDSIIKEEMGHIRLLSKELMARK